MVASIDNDDGDERTLGVRPVVFPAVSCQPLPGVVLTLSEPQPLLTETVAGPSKVPCLEATLPDSPRAPQSPTNRGATASAPPTTRPGRAAATRRPGTLSLVRRRTRLRPMAMTASGHRRKVSVRVAVSTARRSAKTMTPPTATRKMPQ